MNIVSALIEDIVETARQLVNTSIGTRLDSSLALILDEEANYPLPSLGALVNEGGHGDHDGRGAAVTRPGA